MSLRHSTAFAAILVVFVSACSAVDFNTTFLDGAGQTWTAERMGVVNYALNEWASKIINNETIDITFDFTNASVDGYLGQFNSGGSIVSGTDIRPWTSGLNHVIHFNADLFSTPSFYIWWDPTPATSDDQPFAGWDALSITRHELGHLMGFSGMYMDDFNTASEIVLMESHITNDVFDPTGLAIPMNTGEISHVAQSLDDLMSPSISNSIRRGISSTDLAMLGTAYYDYEIIPEPATILLAAAGLTMLIRRKIRHAA